jgi:hypothetical protein
VLPAIVGPEDGNGEAVDDETNAAKTARPIRILGIKRCTELFRAGDMPEKWPLKRKKFTISQAASNSGAIRPSERYLLYEKHRFKLG